MSCPTTYLFFVCVPLFSRVRAVAVFSVSLHKMCGALVKVCVRIPIARHDYVRPYVVLMFSVLLSRKIFTCGACNVFGDNGEYPCVDRFWLGVGNNLRDIPFLFILSDSETMPIRRLLKPT